MLVDCYDPKGAEVYELIVKQVMHDLQINRSIKDMRVFVDPRDPVFIMAVMIEKTTKNVLIEDFATYKYDSEADQTSIRIGDETYLPNLLKKLWEIEGREKIHQPSRFEIIIENPAAELKELVVYNPAENLKRKVYDAIFRILPEGFRVIKDLSEGNIVAMVCTDELLREEWIEKCREMIKDLKNS
ncbi:MAG TPA: methanogenesis marker 17 protein [Methanobacteriaceae archaeon]|jgi:putative methanogenesis marker protein 17|nr:methanogenesis marker 17 protein [Methanobacteriaceae archaeon]